MSAHILTPLNGLLASFDEPTDPYCVNEKNTKTFKDLVNTAYELYAKDKERYDVHFHNDPPSSDQGDSCSGMGKIPERIYQPSVYLHRKESIYAHFVPKHTASDPAAVLVNNANGHTSTAEPRAHLDRNGTPRHNHPGAAAPLSRSAESSSASQSQPITSRSAEVESGYHMRKGSDFQQTRHQTQEGLECNATSVPIKIEPGSDAILHDIIVIDDDDDDDENLPLNAVGGSGKHPSPPRMEAEQARPTATPILSPVSPKANVATAESSQQTGKKQIEKAPNISLRVIVGVDTTGLDGFHKVEPVWPFREDCSGEHLKASMSNFVDRQFKKAFANVKQTSQLWKCAQYRSFIGPDRNFNDEALSDGKFERCDGAPLATFVEHFGKRSLFLIIILGLVKPNGVKSTGSPEYFESLDEACISLVGIDYRKGGKKTAGKGTSSMQHGPHQQPTPLDTTSQRTKTPRPSADRHNTEGSGDQKKADEEDSKDNSDHDSLYRNDTPPKSKKYSPFEQVYVGQVKESIYKDPSRPMPLNAVVMRRRRDGVYCFWLEWHTWEDRKTALKKPDHRLPGAGKVLPANIDFRGPFKHCNRMNGDRNAIVGAMKKIIEPDAQAVRSLTSLLLMNATQPPSSSTETLQAQPQQPPSSAGTKRSHPPDGLEPGVDKRSRIETDEANTTETVVLWPAATACIPCSRLSTPCMIYKRPDGGEVRPCMKCYTSQAQCKPHTQSKASPAATRPPFAVDDLVRLGSIGPSTASPQQTTPKPGSSASSATVLNTSVAAGMASGAGAGPALGPALITWPTEPLDGRLTQDAQPEEATARRLPPLPGLNLSGGTLGETMLPGAPPPPQAAPDRVIVIHLEGVDKRGPGAPCRVDVGAFRIPVDADWESFHRIARQHIKTALEKKGMNSDAFDIEVSFYWPPSSPTAEPIRYDDRNSGPGRFFQDPSITQMRGKVSIVNG